MLFNLIQILIFLFQLPLYFSKKRSKKRTYLPNTLIIPQNEHKNLKLYTLSVSMTKERVAIFIDGSNLYYSLKNLKDGRIDFKKLLQLLTKNKMLISTFYYNAPLNI